MDGATATLPPLPPGATPIAPQGGGSSSLPPLPAGASALPPLPEGAAPLNQPEGFDWNDALGTIGGEAGKGVGILRQAAATVSGIDKAARRWLPGLSTTLTQPEKDLAEFAGGSQYDTPEQGAGGFMENAAEFLAGDEALKGLSYTEKLTKLLPALKAVEESPLLAKAVEAMMKQGSIAGAQGFIKSGGDPGEAAKEAATAGVTGGVLEGGGALLGKGLDKFGAGYEDVGGVKQPVTADQRVAKPTDAQQAGQDAIKNAAQDTLRRNLEEHNEGLAVPKSLPALPARTGPYEFTLAGTGPEETTEGDAVVRAAKLPRENIVGHGPAGAPAGPAGSAPARLTRSDAYMHSAAPGETPETVKIGGGGDLTTQDPNVAMAHLNRVNDIIDHPNFEKLAPEHQQQVLDARDNMQQQIRGYREHLQQMYPGYGKANFDQIDVPAEAAKVGSYTEVANRMEKGATDIYEHFNDLTNNKFNAIREANKQAWAKYAGAAGVPAQRDAEMEIDETNRQMSNLMDSIHNAVTPKELSAANELFRHTQTVRAFAEAVDSSFQGNASSSARSWEYRGFNGNQMMSRVNRVVQKIGRTQLDRVVGRDNVDTVMQIARLNMSNAGRAKFGEAVGSIAQELLKHGASIPILAATAGGTIGHLTGIGGYEGAFAGEGLYAATHLVANSIKTNPRVAQNLIFAIESGARPENYAPFVASLIRSERNNQQQQGEGQQ